MRCPLSPGGGRELPTPIAVDAKVKCSGSNPLGPFSVVGSSVMCLDQTRTRRTGLHTCERHAAEAGAMLWLRWNMLSGS